MQSGERIVGRRVVLLRHGSRPAGEDPWLDPTGEREAKQAAAYLSSVELGTIGGNGAISSIFASPFMRTLQTAVPVAQKLGLLVKVEFGFCELLAKGWLQQADPLPAIRQRDLTNLPNLQSYIDHNYRTAVMPTFPEVTGKMTPADDVQRAPAIHRHRRAIQAALEKANGGSVLIVCHGSTHDFVASALCPDQHELMHHTGHFCVPHCAITEFVEQADGWHLKTYGRTPMDLGFIDIDELIWRLKLGDPILRRGSVEQLGQLGRSGDVRAAKPVAACLKDSSVSVRKAAMQALHDIVDGGDIVTLEAARDAVSKCDCKLRRKALVVLGITDGPLALLGGTGKSRREKEVGGVVVAAALGSVALLAGAAVFAALLRRRKRV